VEYRSLRLTLEPPLARIVLARPEAGNRVDTRMLHELESAAEEIGAQPSISLVVLSGEGHDFCAGWDEVAKAELVKPDATVADPFGCLASLPGPVLVAVHGSVHSAGLELALASDIRIASSDARFALPDVGEGRLPLAGGSQRLPRVVGRSVATSMLLLGDELDADVAYRAGLVSRVFPPEHLPDETDALARRIAANGPIALRYVKEAIHNGIELPLDQALRYELDLSVILQTTRDRAEGVRAFLEKRRPDFEGR
jgi:enoyl-CoA hydratase/carnithine racemase